MVYKKDPQEILGLFCRADQTFYYLETGGLTRSNIYQRLQQTLTSRGLVTVDPKKLQRHGPALVGMTMADALEKGCEVKPVYLNDAVKRRVEAQKQIDEGAPGWR